METEKTQLGTRGGDILGVRPLDQTNRSLCFLDKKKFAAEKFAAEKLPAEKLPADNKLAFRADKKCEDLIALSDKQLFQLCQEYGMTARKWSRKFAALLPEVFKRELYTRQGFYSIYEFAAKIGGLNKKTVKEVLRVYRRVEDKPLLRAEIESQGWGKVRTVAGIATVENEETLVDLVKTLPKKALEEYVRGVKKQAAREAENQEACAAEKRDVCVGISMGNEEVRTAAICKDPPGWSMQDEKCGVDEGRAGKEEKRRLSIADSESRERQDESEENRCGKVDEATEKWGRVSFKLDPNTELRLRKYQQKLEKERKQAVGFNEVMKSLLDGVKGELRGSVRRKVSSGAVAVNWKRSGFTVAARDENGKLARPQKSGVVRKKCRETGAKQAKPQKSGAAADREKSEGSAAACEKCRKIGAKQVKSERPASRHIPVEIRRRLDKKYQGRCGYPGCNKPHEVYHHPRRFALTKNHEDVIPLCHEHHQIAHAGLIEGEEEREDRWRLRKEVDWTVLEYAVDRRVRQFRGG